MYAKQEAAVIDAKVAGLPLPPDRYAVTIKRTRVVEKLTGREWQVVDQVRVDEDDRPYRGQNRTDEPVLKNVMGYTPQIVKRVEEEETVYEQTVDGLDLVRVIRAINGIE